MRESIMIRCWKNVFTGGKLLDGAVAFGILWYRLFERADKAQNILMDFVAYHPLSHSIPGNRSD